MIHTATQSCSDPPDNVESHKHADIIIIIIIIIIIFTISITITVVQLLQETASSHQSRPERVLSELDPDEVTDCERAVDFIERRQFIVIRRQLRRLFWRTNPRHHAGVTSGDRLLYGHASSGWTFIAGISDVCLWFQRSPTSTVCCCSIIQRARSHCRLRITLSIRHQSLAAATFWLRWRGWQNQRPPSSRLRHLLILTSAHQPHRLHHKSIDQSMVYQSTIKHQLLSLWHMNHNLTLKSFKTFYQIVPNKVPFQNKSLIILLKH